MRSFWGGVMSSVVLFETNITRKLTEPKKFSVFCSFSSRLCPEQAETETNRTIRTRKKSRKEDVSNNKTGKERDCKRWLRQGNKRAAGLQADEPSSQRTEKPTCRKGNRPKSQRAEKPTDRKANGPQRQQTKKPTDQKANGPRDQRTAKPTDRETNELRGQRGEKPALRRYGIRIRQTFRAGRTALRKSCGSPTHTPDRRTDVRPV